MLDPWMPILLKLKLSRTEQGVVKRYQADPTGRSFLPVADILRNHNMIDESLELLMQGVERHPGFTVARVVLARELLNKGMVQEAWHTLEDSPESLHENALALKLQLKLAILLGLTNEAHEVNEHMKVRRLYDVETEGIGNSLATRRFDRVRRELIQAMQRSGIPLLIDPDQPIGRRGLMRNVAPAEETDEAPVVAGEAAEEEAAAEGPDDMEGLEGFHVVPLKEIFTVAESAEAKGYRAGGVELDSTTLADIYEKQGHYHRALEIYRRLLRLAPNNELLKRKVAEMSRLKREQREQDLEVDPEIVDKMETIEIIERQLRFLGEMLAKLD